MKIFTVEEANALLPKIQSELRKLRDLYIAIAAYRNEAEKAAGASSFGGGMVGGAAYVQALYEIGRIMTDLNEAGIQLKDHERGLIDFPSMRNGRVVLLCWQLGEPEYIEWWHEVEDGFAGRKPL